MASAIIVGFDGSESARATLLCALRRMCADDTIVVAHAPAVPAAMIENPYYYERALERALEHGQGLLDGAKRTVDLSASASPAWVPTHTPPPGAEAMSVTRAPIGSPSGCQLAAAATPTFHLPPRPIAAIGALRVAHVLPPRLCHVPRRAARPRQCVPAGVLADSPFTETAQRPQHRKSDP